MTSHLAKSDAAVAAAITNFPRRGGFAAAALGRVTVDNESLAASDDSTAESKAAISSPMR